MFFAGCSGKVQTNPITKDNVYNLPKIKEYNNVISNDYMAMSATFTKAMVENNNVVLPLDEAKKLLIEKRESDHFVEETFRGLYYKDEENRLIDVLRTNIAAIRDQYKKAIAMTALIRACTKKRPRGIFTYTGDRYNDGRKDLQKSLEQQFLEAVESINNARKR